MWNFFVFIYLGVTQFPKSAILCFLTNLRNLHPSFFSEYLFSPILSRILRTWKVDPLLESHTCLSLYSILFFLSVDQTVYFSSPYLHVHWYFPLYSILLLNPFTGVFTLPVEFFSTNISIWFSFMSLISFLRLPSCFHLFQTCSSLLTEACLSRPI